MLTAKEFVAKIESENVSELTKIIVNDIRNIDGILDTKTLIGTEL